MDLELAGRVALVVGGNGFIGAAVVERLRAEGATVVVASRRPGDGVRLDGRDDASAQQAVAAVVAEHGRLDALIVSAAPPAQQLDRSRDTEPAQVLDAVDGKAMVFLRTANAAIPTMRDAGFGRIVVISGQNAWYSGSVTASVRNAVTNVVAKDLADALAGTGVTVNAVNPGPVTEDPAAEVDPGAPGQSSPEQIADLVAFLVSPRTATVSGESIATGHRARGTTGL